MTTRKIKKIVIPISHIKEAIGRVDYELSGKLHTTKFPNGLIIELPNAVGYDCLIEITYEETETIGSK